MLFAALGGVTWLIVHVIEATDHKERHALKINNPILPVIRVATTNKIEIFMEKHQRKFQAMSLLFFYMLLLSKVNENLLQSHKFIIKQHSYILAQE